MAAEDDRNEVTSGYAHCRNNDVHLPHDEGMGRCFGITDDGTGLFVSSSASGVYLDPWPQHPQAFRPGTLDKYLQQPAVVAPEAPDTFKGQVHMVDPVLAPVPPMQNRLRFEDQKLDIRFADVPKSEEHICGLYNAEGRSLVEFCIIDGKLDAKYYASDLTEAAQLFVEFLKTLGVDG